MSKIYNNITELVGNTPLVRMGALNTSKADILMKLESFNPGGSVKDRIALQMIQDALEDGTITKDTTLVEATSGNTGIGLAMVCAALQMKLIIVMPESMSIERRRLIEIYGATLILTEAKLGMKGSIAKAEELVAEHDTYRLVRQFENKSNPHTHYLNTANEILADSDQQVDIFIAGVGTGGTISGVGCRLKAVRNVEIIAVEAKSSPVLSGGAPGPHKIQGISGGFIPDNYDASVVDEIIQVTNEDAIACARALIREEGISVGISSGAVISAALHVAKRHSSEGKRIVILLADGSERYMSTDLFNFSD